MNSLFSQFSDGEDKLHRLALARANSAEVMRLDASGVNPADRPLARYDAAVKGLNAASAAASVAEFNALAGSRLDADGLGIAFANDLAHVYSEVLREERPVNTARSFPLDTSVPAAAQEHIVRRLSSTGSAGFHRAGNENEHDVSHKQVEQRFPVRTIKTGFSWDMFDEQAASFANFQLVRESARTAREAIDDFLNGVIWNGSEEDGVYGILTYPWLPKKVSTLAFTGVPADSRTHLAELNAWTNYAPFASKGRMSPTHVRMTPRFKAYLSETIMGTSSQIAGGSLLQAYLNAHPEITIETSWELENAGGDGVDGVFFYRKERNSICVVIPQDVTNMPIERKGFTSSQTMYMRYGGVVMRNVGHNLLVFVQVE